MPKFIFLSLVVSTTVFAQKESKDIYQVTGFTPPSNEEIETLYNETYISLKRATDCRKQYMAGHRSQGQAACVDADKVCGGSGMIDSKQRWVEDNYRAFLGTFGPSSLASYGVEECQSTKFNYYKAETFNGKPDGMSCWTQGAPGAEYGEYSKAFEVAHHALINAEARGDKKAKKYLDQMNAAVASACKAYAENTNKKGLSNVRYSVGHDGVKVARTVKNVESLKEALPLIHFSVVRNEEMGHDYIGSSSGSSNKGSDAVLKELEHDLMQRYYKAYDGNRFAGFHDKKSQNPFLRMRGMNEGNEKQWNEEGNPGSAGVVFWEMCVVQDGSGKKPGLEEPISVDPMKGGQKTISLINEHVSVELPDNIVSPYPLTVNDGKIVGVDLTSTERSGLSVPKLDQPAYAYGPRNSNLSPHDKAIMVEGATAMKNKAKGFVDQLIDNPGETFNLEKSALVIASCSNHLRNQPGFKVWKTDSAPEKREGNERLSFEELSNQRSDAQYFVLTALIKKEMEGKIKELSEEKKILGARKVKAAEGSSGLVQIENRLSYLDNQLNKMKSMDVSKIKKNVVHCDAGGEKGVGGPTPYFQDLKAKYGNKKWPVRSGSESVYYSEVALISKELKKLDVEEKLKQTKEALAKMTDSPESKITSAIYKDWISKYQDILDGKDGKPGYLNIPLLNNDKVFPCDMSRPGDNITCDIVSETSKSLDAFKVEKFMADVQVDKMQVAPRVNDGWHDRKPAVYEPGGAKIFHASALCNRKYQEDQSSGGKAKKCKSKSTGAWVNCATGMPWTGSEQ